MEKYNIHALLDMIMDHKELVVGIVGVSSIIFLYLLFLIMKGLYVTL